LSKLSVSLTYVYLVSNTVIKISTIVTYGEQPKNMKNQ